MTKPKAKKPKKATRSEAKPRKLKALPPKDEEELRYEAIARNVIASATEAIASLVHLPCQYDGDVVAKGIALAMMRGIFGGIQSIMTDEARRIGFHADQLSDYEYRCLEVLLNQVASHSAPKQEPPQPFLQHPASA